MSVQFITDNSGKTTGVFIPIEQWIKIKEKFKDMENEELEIPQWHKDELDKRMDDYKANPGQVIDADKALEDINNSL